MIYFNLKWEIRRGQHNKTRRGFWYDLLHKIFISFSANPDFDDKIEDVVQWFIEYDDVRGHIANREIGIGQNGKIIVKMPDERNYGYWLDTNCDWDGFNKMGIHMITEKEFNDLWNSVEYDTSTKTFRTI